MPPGRKLCAIEGCGLPHHARGWCMPHYKRWRKTVEGVPSRPTPVERFWSKVDKDGPLPVWAPFLGPCWLWTRATSFGYGVLNVGGVTTRSHRFSYELLVGPIPEGLQIDHLCRIRNCVNPGHLEPVTLQENSLRGFCPSAINARKTHCNRGHKFTEENTWVDSEGKRNCRACWAPAKEVKRVRREREAAHATG